MSVHGPLLFLVYINDIVENIESGITLFADATSLPLIVRNPSDEGMTHQDDIDRINNWAESWLVKFNPAKSELLVISRKTSKTVHPNLNMSNTPIPNVKTHKHLGIHLSSDDSWDFHITNIVQKA